MHTFDVFTIRSKGMIDRLGDVYKFLEFQIEEV